MSEVLAALHAQAFDHPWSAEAFADLIASGAFVIEMDGGFILARAAGGEAEILTLAVAPTARRRGLGRALVRAAAVEARARGADTLFLEVAQDNGAALALYHSAGFSQAGRRPRYYGRTIDALILSRPLSDG